jgi:WhiB family transcriptional regulator, redox-sensing transcriptional regulator
MPASLSFNTRQEAGPASRAGWHTGEIDVTVTMDHRSDLMSRTSWVEDWAQRGACGSSDPDALFVQGAAQQQAKTVCLGCPVIAECLADALDNRTEFGVWGGMTERERRALLKRRPDITSWASLFAQARTTSPADTA